MNRFHKKNLAGLGAAAVLIGGLAAGAHIANGGSVLGIGHMDFESEIELALPKANMTKAGQVSDAICDQGILAGAFQLGNASEQTSQAAMALTVHQCRDSFVNQVASFAGAFDADDKDFRVGMQAVKQIDPNDAQQVLAFVQADGQGL